MLQEISRKSTQSTQRKLAGKRRKHSTLNIQRPMQKAAAQSQGRSMLKAERWMLPSKNGRTDPGRPQFEFQI
jgi:hypothetical protein